MKLIFKDKDRQNIHSVKITPPKLGDSHLGKFNDISKNILIGMGSALVIMPTGSVNQIRPPQKTDAENLASDWQRVGNDLYMAMGQVDDEQKRQVNK